METLQASAILSSSSSSCCHRRIEVVLQAPKHGTVRLSIPKLPSRNLVDNLNMRGGYTTTTTQREKKTKIAPRDDEDSTAAATMISELYMIAEVVVDRVEMHSNIGDQRDNWNTLLRTCINIITLSASTMAGLAAAAGMGTPLLVLKISSVLLYSAATRMLMVMNKIQPSQLAEEQRNATRLFKQLHGEIQTKLAIGNPTRMDVKDSMEKVLALDKAYPLPLLGTMLDKFPAKVEPAIWWPSQSSPRQGRLEQQNLLPRKIKRNGWSDKLEEEMREIVGVLMRKDIEEYLRLDKLALKINKILAILGPLLTGIATVGSAFVGSPTLGSSSLAVSLVAEALASIVNTLEHGGQVGMVFEMYRSNAGFLKLMEESIESMLKERDVEKIENGESFEMKVALRLGRSLLELRDLTASCRDAKATDKFASKLF